MSLIYIINVFFLLSKILNDSIVNYGFWVSGIINNWYFVLFDMYLYLFDIGPA